ncbi:MAG TPA: zinc ribbon domain-containing protein [Coriobacteriia bacterium]
MTPLPLVTAGETTLDGRDARMSAEMAAFCHQCGKPLAQDDTFCTECGAKRLEIAQAGESCARCGAAWKPDDAFCMGCGAPRAAAPAAGVEAPTPAPAAPAAPAVVRRVASVAGAAAGMGGVVGALAGGGGIALPWQTITTGQPIDVAGLARAAAPSLLAMAPKPNLRWPAAGIAVTVVMDVIIALVSGGAVNVPMLVFRVLSGLGTSVLGAIAGKGGGVLRKLTGAASIVYALVQFVSLVVGAFGALKSPASLLMIVPSIVAVLSGLVLSVSTAVAGLRK